MRLVPLLLALAVFASGCLGGSGPSEPTPGDTPDAPLQAPWWTVGESWTIRFELPGKGTRTTTLVNFANSTAQNGLDPAHFWLGVRDRDEAMSHVFFDDNPFLGRIHHELLAPHEKGMHSAMYTWPMSDGSRWVSPILLGKEDIAVEATAHPDGTYAIEGEARADGADVAYDYDPATRWFRHILITNADGSKHLEATVTDHRTSGASGSHYFLRGLDYLDADGGTTGQEDPFTVKDEGATSIAFLVDVQAGPGSSIQFIAPDGSLFHEERLLTGGTSDKIFEAKNAPPAGAWKLRYVGSVTGEIKVRGIIEYKGTL